MLLDYPRIRLEGFRDAEDREAINYEGHEEKQYEVAILTRANLNG
jgi:hypothetical protein